MRFVAVQKPVQDIYTAGIFGAMLLLVVMTAVTANTVLQQSGNTQSGLTRTSDGSGHLDTPMTGLTVHGNAGLNECEVIYHLASQGGDHVIIVSGEGQEEDAATLFHAVYTCIERSPTIEDYI